jgi:DNA-binding transcriptional regulator YiaG
MPNIAAVLKDEIRRLARKEIKATITRTKQVVLQYRKDIRKLTQLVESQQKRLVALVKQRGAPEPAEEDPLDGIRYSARSVRAQRNRLGLSAEDYGRLVGVSSLTIFNWEHGKARPRAPQLAALIAVRGIGKREALKRLAEMGQTPKRKGRPRKARG